MAVGFQFDCFFYQVGHGDFLHSFFSTISYHLEPDGWGTKYPKLLKDLYYKKLKYMDIPKAIKETEEIRAKLVNFSPSQVVWDIDDLTAQPPWGNRVSEQITNLSQYFKTSDGRDLFDLLLISLNGAYDDKFDLEIRSL
ncbi:immunity 70 family protein [Neobacillus sp. WH10]|uniref:immunity 70 family protein n=1 Tax=Neobacillus sp. WH10 TaxID=3047873 RepID=UPI0024C16BF4|nr:immunity 70 family protein [Neobacillus sp. WH10]WHY80222.1 immunity 70 family protein [Neobacillus sp. WH10]